MAKKSIKISILNICNAKIKDIPKILALERKVYPNMSPATHEMIAGQIRHFPEGQFIAIYDDKIIGYCSSLRIAGKLALKTHTWDKITGKGLATTHNPKGDYLYGVELYIDPEYRSHHIGHRFYNERKKLCSRLNLKGIIFGSRMQYLAKKIKNIKTPKKYLELVYSGKIYDPAISFQLHNGFEILGVLKNYFPEDKDSLGYAAHCIWHNPELPAEHGVEEQGEPSHFPQHVLTGHIRVATVQYEQRHINSFDDFKRQVTYFVSVVAEYRSDFVVFPELFTMQLLSIENAPLSPHASIQKLASYTEQFKEFMNQLAMKYDINIIAGSHPTKNEEGIENIAYVFLRDGSIHMQAKIHPTPNERYVWRMKGANKLNAIMTDCGPIGVLICYDNEFPELARHLIDQGIYILFIPFCTDERQGYLRVRYCAQARAVENQCYVAMAGNVGNLPGVHNMNVQYAQSCILTPCDFPFSRDGIAADTTPNVETIAVADLSTRTLISARNAGTVLNLKDRRQDLYKITWKTR